MGERLTMEQAVNDPSSEINKFVGDGIIKLVRTDGTPRIRKVIIKVRVDLKFYEPDILTMGQDKEKQAKIWQAKTENIGRPLLGKVGRVYGESSNSGLEVFHNMQDASLANAIQELKKIGYIPSSAYQLTQESKYGTKVFLCLELTHKSCVTDLSGNDADSKAVRDSIKRALVVMPRYTNKPCYMHVWDNLAKLEKAGKEESVGQWDSFRTVTINMIPIPAIKESKIARRVVCKDNSLTIDPLK